MEEGEQTSHIDCVTPGKVRAVDSGKRFPTAIELVAIETNVLPCRSGSNHGDPLYLLQKGGCSGLRLVLHPEEQP